MIKEIRNEAGEIMGRLSEDIMFVAIIANDAYYDGLFYYAVKTTGIVCRPSCRSKQPKRDHVAFFHTLEEAVRQGYRPCKRCRPDLGTCYAPEAQIIATACEMIEQEYSHPALLKELPRRLGVSFSHFQRLFKRETGQTPREYLQRHRIMKATEMLRGSTMSNTDVCLAAGFSTLSNFYAAFRAATGLSPKEYKQNQLASRNRQ
jgi:AraC family transcriptional regulator of adaptative response / methylphosphotriester-DNA alkyltransferase methyltransferase